MSERWNQYVLQSLLARLRGLEEMRALACIAQSLIQLTLAETNCEFDQPLPVLVQTGNPLRDSNEQDERAR